MSGLTARGSVRRLGRDPAAAWRHLDLVLIGCVAAIATLGVLMVYSATRGAGGPDPHVTTFLQRQMLFVGVGFGVMTVVALIDYRRYRDLAPAFYGAVVLLLLLVVSPLGSEQKGTQAWFDVGPYQFQPSEFTKLAVIVGVAALLANFRDELHLPRLVLILGLVSVPLALIMLQPDLGTALIIAAVTAGLLLIGGADPRHLLLLVAAGALSAVVVLNSPMLEDYQRARLTTFLSQDDNETAVARGDAYNLNQSKIAIGAGGWFGAGLFQGSQTRLNNVPEQHTDFIFTAVGEELGFLGAGTLLALFCILCWRVWRAAQLARDDYGTLVCTGVLAMLLFQIFQNVGMTMGIMPITGIPLPFVSYGGSSTIAAFAAIGLVLNVHARRFS